MAWIDRLRPASFRGIPFGVFGHDSSGGRVVIVHTYRGSERRQYDEVHGQDRRRSIEGYIVGEDYDQAAAALEDALNQPGIGRLVHPWYGELDVYVHHFTRSDRERGGGEARFSMDMERVFTGEDAPPQGDDSAARADELDREAEAEAIDAWSREDHATGPQSIRDATFDALSNASARIRSLDVFSGPRRAVDQLQRQLQNVVNDGRNLIVQPAALVNDTFEMVRSVGAAAGSITGAFAAYESLALFRTPRIPGTSRTALRANANAQRMNATVRMAALAQLVDFGARMRWTSFQEAERARDVLTAQADEIEGAISERADEVLRDIRAALQQSIPAPDADLPRERELVLSRSLPAVVVAQQLYGDGAREEDILTRNGIDHPLFVPGGVALEVLEDA